MNTGKQHYTNNTKIKHLSEGYVTLQSEKHSSVSPK